MMIELCVIVWVGVCVCVFSTWRQLFPCSLSQGGPETGNGRWYTRRMAWRKCVRCVDEEGEDGEKTDIYLIIIIIYCKTNGRTNARQTRARGCCNLNSRTAGSSKFTTPPFFLNNSGSRRNLEVRFHQFLGVLNPHTLVVHPSKNSQWLPCGDLYNTCW